MTATGVAAPDPKARAFLRNADPVLRRLIDARPDFRPRAWLDELPPLDAFGTLIFQVAGQQLAVRATRTIVSRLEDHFGGRLPTARSCSQRTRTSLAPAAFLPARARRCGRWRNGSSTVASATRPCRA